MTETSSGGETQDEELLADLFDSLLQEILEGRTPDLQALHQDRPELRARIQKTWSLACSVAGRREPSRPVFGGYEILRELGHGGMGTVYLARHQTLQREVAIKVLPQSLAMSPRAKQRFVEEARTLAQLRHENVVHIHRIVDHAEMLAFEMEYIDGPSLQHLLVALRKQAKPFALQSLAEAVGVPADRLGVRNGIEWFVRLGIRIARALGEVHRLGLVHRDVKPANILLRKDGTPVLADFGLALQADLDDKPSRFAGTPVYAAPERLRGDALDADAKTDVYSLGASLYEALTLCPPFRGSTTQDVLRHIEAGRARPMRQIAPHVSQDLATIVTKAMELDAKHRYATADELADDLERLLNLQPILARPVGPVRRCVKFVRRHRQASLAAVAGAVLVALIAWPLAVLANSRGAARELAATATHDARTVLLGQDALPPWWQDRAATSRSVHQPRGQVARREALTRAVGHYRRALAADPENEHLRAEAAAVDAARLLLEDEPVGARSAPDDLTPLACRAWHLASPDDSAPALSEQDTRAATQADLFAAGLFSFLTGDQHTCQLCWQALPPQPAGAELVDACSALAMATAGRAAQAYPRVFHAARAFPEASALVLAMADGATEAGDLAMAKQWFLAIPVAEDPTLDAPRRLLEADLLAAEGQLDEARRSYRALSMADPTDPRPVMRLARLALQGNDLESARRLWRTLLRRWPDLVPARRQLARLALQYRDTSDYLRQVRDAMAAHAGEAVVEDLLRLAGLHLGEAPPALPLQGSAFPDALPLAAWLPKTQMQGIEQVLRFLSQLHDVHQLSIRIDPRPVGAAIICAPLAALRLPALTLRLPWQLQALLAALPVLSGGLTERISLELLPYQTILGDRLRVIGDRRLFQQTSGDRTLFYGAQMLAIGDLDGDTLGELCIAAPPYGGNFGNGMIEFRASYDGSWLDTWRSQNEHALFGRAIADLHDVDADLCPDILIGSPIGNIAALHPATVELRSGRTGRQIWQIECPYPSFGAALASIDDIDSDDTRDFVVGIPPMSLGETGRAWICSGKTGKRLHELKAARTGVWFGGAVAAAGDVNGDGLADVLVGGNYGRAPGLVGVYDGRTGELLLSLADADATTLFGASMCALRDVDTDGSDDLAIGVPGGSARGAGSGSVLVISGRTGKTLYELHGEHSSEAFGNRLCPLADWRGDQRPALAVAAQRGGPIGNGYVRIFDLATASPMQTFAGSSTQAIFGYSMVDLGDRDGDGLRELGVMTLSVDFRSSLWVTSFADARSPENRTR